MHKSFSLICNSRRSWSWSTNCSVRLQSVTASNDKFVQCCEQVSCDKCADVLGVQCRTLICTEECLLHPSRNPSLGREGIEAALKEYLGLKKILWLWKGMAGDDAITNGHVDNLACFVRPGVVALSWTDDVNDPQVIGCWFDACKQHCFTQANHHFTCYY